MWKTFIFLDFIIFTLGQTQICDMRSSFIYQNSCISKTCLFDKLSRIQLVPFNNIDTNIGQLDMGIGYKVTSDQSTGSSQYKVTIRYGDTENNQLVSDPVNCINWRIYQIKNSPEIDQTRLNIAQDEDVPSWPKANYSYNSQISGAELTFTILQRELDNYQCNKFTESNLIQWQCFFEVAFVIKGISQISHYLAINVDLDLKVTTNVIPTVNFQPLIQIDNCPKGGEASPDCKTQVSVSASFWFCQTKDCLKLSPKPFYVLFVNRLFWLKHVIDDEAFQANWFLEVSQLIYQSFGFTLKLSPGAFQILVNAPGYNIYQLKVPIVSNNVLITAIGNLVQVGSQGVQIQDYIQPVVISELNTGLVGQPNATFFHLNNFLTKQLLKELIISATYKDALNTANGTNQTQKLPLTRVLDTPGPQKDDSNLIPPDPQSLVLPSPKVLVINAPYQDVLFPSNIDQPLPQQIPATYKDALNSTNGTNQTQTLPLTRVLDTPGPQKDASNLIPPDPQSLVLPSPKVLVINPPYQDVLFPSNIQQPLPQQIPATYKDALNSTNSTNQTQTLLQTKVLDTPKPQKDSSNLVSPDPQPLVLPSPKVLVINPPYQDALFPSNIDQPLSQQKFKKLYDNSRQ